MNNKRIAIIGNARSGKRKNILAKEYTIAGSVGDRDADFLGGYTGYTIKLPNYVYA